MTERSGEDHSADRTGAAYNKPAQSFIRNTREETSELFLVPGIREHAIRRHKRAEPFKGSFILLLLSLIALTVALPYRLKKFSLMAVLAAVLYQSYAHTVMLLSRRGAFVHQKRPCLDPADQSYLRFFRGPPLLFRLHIWAKCKVIDSRKPKKIVRLFMPFALKGDQILIRHGESEGNVDKTIYCRIPDHRVPLSQKGKKEAEEAGKHLRNLIGDDTLRFFVSPYLRSQQTFEHMLKGGLFAEGKYTVREDARLREQDFGNLQVAQDMDKALIERKFFGSFYYRFPNGESGADVFDRSTSFWASLMREFKYQHCLEHFVIVSHGITCRMLLMRYFKWTVTEFEQLWNFENCEMAVLERGANGHYELITPLRRSRTRKISMSDVPRLPPGVSAATVTDSSAVRTAGETLILPNPPAAVLNDSR